MYAFCFLPFFGVWSTGLLTIIDWYMNFRWQRERDRTSWERTLLVRTKRLHLSLWIPATPVMQSLRVRHMIFVSQPSSQPTPTFEKKPITINQFPKTENYLSFYALNALNKTTNCTLAICFEIVTDWLWDLKKPLFYRGRKGGFSCTRVWGSLGPTQTLQSPKGCRDKPETS